MNMSHVGGTNEFNITTYNIDNVTLDIGTMYANRRSLFGWDSVSWGDAVNSLFDSITININTTDGLTSLRFVDNPETGARVYVDGAVYQNWSTFEEVELYGALSSGEHVVILEFNAALSLYDIIMILGTIAIIMGLMTLLIRTTKRYLFDEFGRK